MLAATKMDSRWLERVTVALHSAAVGGEWEKNGARRRDTQRQWLASRRSISVVGSLQFEAQNSAPVAGGDELRVEGISEVAEAYVAAIKSAAGKGQDDRPQKSVQEKVSTFTENLRSDHSTAVGKMQDGLQYLTYLVLSTSMPAAA